MPPKKPTKPPVMLCSRCKRLFYSSAVATCPHPGVNQCFGEHICMYCCMKCKHHIKNKIPHGVKCGYGGDINE